MPTKPAYKIHVTGARSGSTQALLRKAIRKTLRQHAVQRAQLSIALVDDRTIAKLNRTHLGHLGATDVLSFDLRDDASPLGKGGSRGVIDGEIVVSSQRAAREARRRGHLVNAELTLYAVHGLLHLLGYDDATRREALRMHRMANQVLSSLGLEAIAPVPHSGQTPVTLARKS